MTDQQVLSRRQPSEPEPIRGVPSRTVYRLKMSVLHIVSTAIGFFIVVPILFGVMGGFTDNGQLTTNPLGLPKPWHPEKYLEIIASGNFWRQLFNSTVIALGTVI